MYKDAQVPDPVIGDWCGKYAKELDPEKAAKDAPYGNFGNEYARHSKRYYYANITFIDEQIGRVLQTLKDKGMYDNSLIIFVSDHGDMMGDHYHWRKTTRMKDLRTYLILLNGQPKRKSFPAR